MWNDNLRTVNSRMEPPAARAADGRAVPVLLGLALGAALIGGVALALWLGPRITPLIEVVH
jgi:hypothetical protein